MKRNQKACTGDVAAAFGRRGSLHFVKVLGHCFDARGVARCKCTMLQEKGTGVVKFPVTVTVVKS